MFVAGLAVFALSSLLCGFALVVDFARRLPGDAGSGGALLLGAGAALSLLMTTFAEGHEAQPRAGIYGAASGSGAAAGVLLGGGLTSYLGWSSIFFINVPVGAAAIALTPVLLRESRADLLHRPLRSHRRGVRHERADAPRLRTDGARRPTAGACSSRHARLARSLGCARRSVHLDRVALARPAPAAADLPPACPLGRERDDGARRCRHVLGVLRPHALRPGRPPPLGRTRAGVAFVAIALSVVVMSNVVPASSSDGWASG